ncbi:hypothetical protein CPC735_039440 [Paecilomyces variotii No. 5]|uniref:Uncharacterized protein n=1 Tax=Byssochlamys spectabilis (strain No. 5 / NBRC 109023) TaxID=1356009 RepID=V5FSI2_BYSSN|nr:hypothetical protein CPC735_039440 [Paecilomyces variotii No. 5]
MPTLKQLTCHVEWTPSDTPFREYGIGYGDGVVESYIAIPAGSTPFSINLRSDGFIAPGLAMFVFVDGVYQCNRYRGDLQNSNKVTMGCLSDTVDFRVRQKEEHLPDGGWIGRPWRFEPLNIGPSSNDVSLSSHFKHLGTIHVLVLRCLPDAGLPEYAASGFDLGCPASPESATAVMSDDETSFAQSSHGQTKCRHQSLIQSYAGFDGPGDSPYYEPRHGRPYDQFRHSKSSARDGRSKSWRRSGAASSDDWNKPGHNSDWADVPVRRKGSSTKHLDRDQRSESTTSSDVSCQTASSRGLDANYAEDIEPFGPTSTARNRARIARSQMSYTPGGTPIVVNINPVLSPERQVTQSRGRGLPEESITTDHVGHGHVGSNKGKGNREHNVRRCYRDSDRAHEYQYSRQDKRRNMRHGGVDPASSPEDSHSRGRRQHDGRDSEWDTNLDMDHGANSNSPSTGWKPPDESSPPTSDNGNWDSSDPQITQPDDPQSEDADPFNNNGTQEGNGRGQTDTDASFSHNESWPKEGKWQSNTTDSSEGHNWNSSQDIDQDTTAEKQPHVDEHSTTPGVGTWSSSGNNQQGATHKNTADPMNNHGAETGRIREQDPRILRETPVPWQGSNPSTNNAAYSPAAIRPQQITHGNNSLVFVSPLATGSDGNEPALYMVPASIAQSGLLSHQVQLGSAAEYVHRVRQPAYIDSLEHPYAKFIFKYRTQGAIEQLLGIKIERNLDEERRKLENISKEELIARILHTEVGLSGGNSDIPRNYQGGAPMSVGGNIKQSNAFETRGPHYQGLNRPALNTSGHNDGHFATMSGGNPPEYKQNSTDAGPFLMGAASGSGYSSNTQDSTVQPSQGSWDKEQPDGRIHESETKPQSPSANDHSNQWDSEPTLHEEGGGGGGSGSGW